MVTEEPISPPASSISFAACERVYPSSVPVKTTISPANAPPAFSLFLLCGVTPALRRFSTSVLPVSLAKNAAISRAIISPISSTARSSSSLAAERAETEPKRVARSFAVFLPTLGMPSAKIKAERSHDLDFSMEESRFFAFFS